MTLSLESLLRPRRARGAIAPRWWSRWLRMTRPTPKALSGAVSADELAAQAFQELFSRYQKPIADFLYRMTRDREWAADLTQDTFMKAYAHLGELPTILNVRAWLYRIAANTARNALRRQRRFLWLSLADMPATGEEDGATAVVVAAPGDLAVSVVERDALERALQTLSPTARAVILLRATGGFDTAEIATMLRISEANARKVLYRAKEKLRVALTTGDAASGEERG